MVDGGTRVFLADDHRTVLEALARLLGSRFEVVGTAPTLEACLWGVRATRPDVAVLDLYLGDGPCFDLIRELSTRLALPRVVVVSGMADGMRGATLAFQAGARGFVSKASSASTLFRAIKRVHAGEVYLDPKLGLELSATAAPERALLCESGMSAREREVFDLLGSGLGTKEIAAKLFISVVTVRTHLSHIQQKLGCSTRAALVAHAVRARSDDGVSFGAEATHRSDER